MMGNYSHKFLGLSLDVLLHQMKELKADHWSRIGRFEFAIGTARERRYIKPCCECFMTAVMDPLTEFVLHSHQYCNMLVPLVPTGRTCTASKLCKPNWNSKSGRIL